MTQRLEVNLEGTKHLETQSRDDRQSTIPLPGLLMRKLSGGSPRACKLTAEAKTAGGQRAGNGDGGRG